MAAVLKPFTPSPSAGISADDHVKEITSLDATALELFDGVGSTVNFVSFDNTANSSVTYLKIFNQDDGLDVNTDTAELIIPCNPNSKDSMEWINGGCTEVFLAAGDGGMSVLATSTRNSLTTQTAPSSAFSVDIGVIQIV